MTLKLLKPGMTMYATHRETMGHTTVKTTYISSIKILEINVTREQVRAMWKGIDRWYGPAHWRKWRLTKPVLMTNPLLGNKRLASREELKAIKGQVKERELEDR